MTPARNARVVVTALGGPEVLKYVEEPLAEPGPGEVRVKILAAGVAYADVLMRRGLYPHTPPPPFTPGYDIVGEVDAVVVNGSSFRPGQRVGAMTVRGGYSQFALVPEEDLVPVPAELDPAEAVCMILNYVTAYQMLHRVANIAKGQSILIHGAAGGVGTALLQLGGLAGLKMYGTASKAKHSLIESYGAVPIDYHTENFSQRIRNMSGEGVDSVFDPVGGMNWWGSYRVLRRGGLLVCYGASNVIVHGKLEAGAGFVILGFWKVFPLGRRWQWFNLTNVRKAHPDWFRQDLAMLFDLLLQKKLQPVIGARLPLREAAKANEWLEQAKVTGKIVLLCQE
jgi:NADPH2:quinone reductase